MNTNGGQIFALCWGSTLFLFSLILSTGSSLPRLRCIPLDPLHFLPMSTHPSVSADFLQFHELLSERVSAADLLLVDQTLDDLTQVCVPLCTRKHTTTHTYSLHSNAPVTPLHFTSTQQLCLQRCFQTYFHTFEFAAQHLIQTRGSLKASTHAHSPLDAAHKSSS